MANLLSVVNDAADVLGLDAVASLEQGHGALLAARVKLQGELVLSTHDWLWASVVRDLEQVGEDPSPYFAEWVIYRRPPGAVRLVRLLREDDDGRVVQYRIDADGIHSELGTPRAHFVTNRPIEEWPQEFAHYVAAAAAAELAPRLRPEKTGDALALAQRRGDTARQSDDDDRGEDALAFDGRGYLRSRGLWDTGENQGIALGTFGFRSYP